MHSPDTFQVTRQWHDNRVADHTGSTRAVQIYLEAVVVNLLTHSRILNGLYYHQTAPW